ncbi:MAG: ATP-binding cassette domain-containing protein [Planctomycetota bacterium]|nr:MAG: ATP-binding cassette domain-containing protein [Planctomycetota bacterium]
MNDCVLRLRGLTKRYGDFLAVDQLDLDVPRGCVLGFLGPNGAGKTTTIRMVLGIYEPSGGTIEVLGAASALDVRHRIGYLPEEKGLYKKMKARDLVAYFAELKGMTARDAKGRATELLDRYGLGEFKDRKCEAMSKGMGQKVQVLASIAHRPEFVILDEPFSGLDPVNQQVMEQVIADMSKDGATIIFSTHVMEHAERLCDRIAMVARGKKVFDGSLAQARAALPTRILIGTGAAQEVLRGVPGVANVESSRADGVYVVGLAPGASADGILGAFVRAGIEVRSFDKREPGLRELFFDRVGAKDAAEMLA